MPEGHLFSCHAHAFINLHSFCIAELSIRRLGPISYVIVVPRPVSAGSRMTRVHGGSCRNRTIDIQDDEKCFVVANVVENIK